MSIATRTLLVIAFSCAIHDARADTFQLREQLGHAWTQEFVSFATFHAPSDRWQLVDATGASVPFQWIKPAGTDRQQIGFQVDLAPYAHDTYRLIKSDRTQQVPTDLRVERRSDELRITNGKVGVALRTQRPTDGRGPVAGIQLESGKWVGDSDLQTDQAVVAWNVRVVANGPVFVEAVVEIKFADQSDWVIRCRVEANEPVVLIDEQCSGRVQGGRTFRLRLDRGFQPQSVFYRLGKAASAGRVGTNVTEPISAGTVFQLEPWLKWWEAERRGPAVSFFNQTDTKLLSIAARNAGVWVDPNTPAADRSPPLVKVVKDASGLHADFAVATGARSWMIGCHDRDQSLAVLGDKATKMDSPIPYRYLIKHGHFPLDRIKEYQLDWNSNVARPRMLISGDDLQRFRARITDVQPYQRQAKYFVDHPPTLTVSSLDQAIPAWVVTQDQRLGERLVEMCDGLIDQWVASLLEQRGMPLGAAPHEKSMIASAFALADLLYDSPHVSEDQRQSWRAKIALLAYTFARPEYWSVERGFAANPNMTTTVYGYRVATACFLGDHPLAKAWATESLAELNKQLREWSDAAGGWLEAPHYAVVSYDQILGALVMASNAGFSQTLFAEPKVKLVARWLAAINTPPDSRIGGYRHHPAIGHTYVNEPCGDFGLLAHLFQQRDPEFSAQMQWQFEQNNRYASAGIGGFFPAFAGFRQMLTDPKLPAAPPEYTSQLFPETGVVLRDQYPSRRETYLHMILGQHREHYDDDSGSIVMYGKGRVLIDEFGYRGFAPASDHSMIESADVQGGSMKPGLFVKGANFDYIEGQRQAWQRRIVMVKGDSPGEPSYFVLNDTIASNSPVTWRAWLTAEDVQIQSHNSVHVTGKEDVDLDVVFLSPAGLKIKIETKTRVSSSGLHPNWSWRAIETTQQGLIATSTSDRGNHEIRTLLFPRLRATPAPRVTALADGKGVRIDHTRGTDYVFLAAEPFQYQAQKVSFAGRAGLVQLRGGKPILNLAGPGTIAAGDQQLSQ